MRAACTTLTLKELAASELAILSAHLWKGGKFVKTNLEQFRSHPYRQSRLKEYFKRMSTPRDKPILDDNVAAMLRAQGYSWEESPRSIYSPEMLFEALGNYAPGKVSNQTVDEHLLSGLALARRSFARPEGEIYLEMLPFTPRTIDLVTSNPGGSAGLTSYGSSKAESKTRALERGLEALKGLKAPEPCLAFARTQFNGKTRLVWGYPYSETAIEGLVAYPYLQLLKGSNTPMAFATSTMALGTKLRVASYHNDWAYSVDMSAFDASISEFLITQAFLIIQTWFDLDSVEPVSGLSCRQIFRHIRKYFLTSPIVMPDGNIYHGRRHGVPSGSFFTQIVDSIVNVVIAGTLSSRFKLHLDRKEIFVLGDDLLFWSDRDIELNRLAQYATETFGIRFNAHKSQKVRSSEPVHYLGRNWTHGIPDLDVEEVVKRMVFPERYRKYSDDPVIRQRQVKLMLLSFASVYWCAWTIAANAVVKSRWSIPPGAIESAVYGSSSVDDVENPDHYSGLMRYIVKYHRERTVSIPHVATLFWT